MFTMAGTSAAVAARMRSASIIKTARRATTTQTFARHNTAPAFRVVDRRSLAAAPLLKVSSVPTPTLGSHTKLSRLLDDAVARVLFAQGNQQGLHLPAVVLDD